MRLHRFLTAVAGLALAGATALAQSKPTVAVLYFNNGATGAANAELAPLSKGIADILIQEMSVNTGIRVVERDQLQKILEEQRLSQAGNIDPATVVRVGKLLGVHHMVTGGFITNRTNDMNLTVRCFNVETGEVEFATNGLNKIDNLFVLVNSVARKINTGLKLPEIPRQVGEAREKAAEKVPYQAVMLYSRALIAKDAGKKDEAVQLFKQTLAKFPEYEAAKKELAKLGA
ncbi:MAG TPA: CsgG/HfaB family protein [Gemmatimonadaceae bacterium]|nr:CsgG/HfaB family protein [Gemmatimonadaceae bacterium]